MPDFAKANISTTSEDLTPYRSFLRKLEVGQTVTLPLDHGESSRKVVHLLNLAAAENEMRLARLPSSNGSVRFRVVSPQKRAMNISEEGKRVRSEKTQATRAAKKRSS